MNYTVTKSPRNDPNKEVVTAVGTDQMIGDALAAFGRTCDFEAIAAADTLNDHPTLTTEPVTGWVRLKIDGVNFLGFEASTGLFVHYENLIGINSVTGVKTWKKFAHLLEDVTDDTVDDTCHCGHPECGSC